MFSKETYTGRRNELRKSIKEGIILLLGNVDVPMNYPSNIYRWRQDSNFMYFLGLDYPGMAAIIDSEHGNDFLFGDDVSLDDIIWMGAQPLMAEKADQTGVAKTLPYHKLHEKLQQAISLGRTIHFLPPYRAENKIIISELLNINPEEQKTKSSKELIRAIVNLRSIKDKDEISELEKAMETAWLMHTTAMKMACPGVYEREIAGAIEGIAISAGGSLSFPAIVSVHGETLHNHYHGNKLKEGDLLLVDAGIQNSMYYSTDHTRTSPVGGKFTSRQKDIYEIVLDAQLQALDTIKPGVSNKSVHMLAATTIARGLHDLGLMRGDITSAVELGAHALFMPHGLGHMMGLDVHDMEDLGEDYVGYDDEIQRSDIFGTAFLRLGRKYQPGFVLTVEPGCYFIPALIEKWRGEQKFTDYINYDKVAEYIGFGGIRIEDDVLVTENGNRLLGKPIPKSVSDIENLMQR